MRNEQLVVSRERLLEEVWGYDPLAMTNTIDVFISNLRRKLEEGGEARLLQTKRGAGYVLRARGGLKAALAAPPLAGPLAARRRLGRPDAGHPRRLRAGRRAAGDGPNPATTSARSC